MRLSVQNDGGVNVVVSGIWVVGCMYVSGGGGMLVDDGDTAVDMVLKPVDVAGGLVAALLELTSLETAA